MKTFLMIFITAVITWLVSTQFGLESPRIIIQSPNPPNNAAILPEVPKSFLPSVIIAGFTMEELVFEKINEVRVENNREPLEWSQHLTQKAQGHSIWMADTGKFMHSTYNYCENIWWGIGISAPRLPDRIIKSWMDSRGHRANLLEVEISKCGIGIAFDESTKSHYATFMAY